MLGPEPPPPPPPAAVKTERPLGSALFWGEGDAIDPDDPDMAALLALQEETPPEERAEAFKDRGNESLRLGTPFHVRQASACYTQALEQGSSDVCANSTYLANRAQAQLLLKNWGRALADGRLALSLNPGNLKAAWRAAKAAAELGRHEEVEQLCAAGLQRASCVRAVSRRGPFSRALPARRRARAWRPATPAGRGRQGATGGRRCRAARAGGCGRRPTSRGESSHAPPSLHSHSLLPLRRRWSSGGCALALSASEAQTASPGWTKMGASACAWC